MNPHLVVVLIIISVIILVFIIHFLTEKCVMRSMPATLTHCKIVVPMNPTNEIHYPKNKVKFLLPNNSALTFKVDLRTFYELEKYKNNSATLTYKNSRFIKFENENFSVTATSDFF